MGKKFNEVTAQPSTPSDTDLVLWGQAAGSGLAYKMTFTQLKAKLDAMASLTTLNTPTLTATVISATQINLSWTNVPHESSYKLEWSANGTTGWTQIGGTIAANTTSFSHTGLTASTAYYYRVSAIGDGVTYATSAFGTANGTTSAAGASLEDLVLNTSNGLSVSGTTWTGSLTGGGGWEGNFGIATKKIATSTDGYFRLRITATDSEPALGIQDANANNKWNGADPWNIGFFCAAGVLYYWNGSLVDTTVGYSNGDYIRIIRTSGTWKLQKSADAISWTDAHTFSETLTGDAWAVLSPKNDSNLSKIYEPKGFNIV
jgi:hypothetical protein